jgi:Rrf2 family nitric oxide-sensitive transcriptional repressor
MELTQSTDLALRVLMLTAVHEDLLTVRDLANQLAVPETHMAKIVQRLQRLGMVATVRGRSGGVRLATATRPTRLGDLVRALEGTAEVIDCDSPPCPLRSTCRLRAILREAQGNFLSTLDGVSLADLVAPPTGAVLVALSAAGPGGHPPSEPSRPDG